MIDEPEDDGDELEFYEPQPVGLQDGDCLIFDHAEFAETFNAHAVQFKGGDMWVLDKDALQWVKVEPHKCAKPRPFKSVQ